MGGYRVYFHCPACGRTDVVMVYEWDIAGVAHTCPERFVLTYDPPRPTF